LRRNCAAFCGIADVSGMWKELGRGSRWSGDSEPRQGFSFTHKVSMASSPERSPLVAQLGLEPHVEGGYYRELWRSEVVLPQAILGERYSGARASASSIYFLLHPGEVSRWHVVVSAELWLYHLGSPLTVTLGGSARAGSRERRTPVSARPARCLADHQKRRPGSDARVVYRQSGVSSRRVSPRGGVRAGNRGSASGL